MLVVDASYAVRACGVDGGFELLGDPDLVAPALLWSEVRSALHEARWRGDIEADDAAEALERLESCPVRSTVDPRLGRTAWEIADELGWAKTYDAEYVALARLLGCRVVTLDGRLLRGAARLGLTVTPGELL
jgi:predicted nucleic acid-binding protein